MEVGYLGPLEVRDAGREVPVPGTRLRRLLVQLALEPGAWVSAGVLAEAVWGDEAPGDPANSLQSLVSRLRRALGRPELVEQSPAGYRLAVDPEDVDGVRFARLVAEGRRAVAAGDDAAAGAALAAALGLWRGRPLADDDAPEATARRTALEDLRVQALADRAVLAVRAGRAPDVLPELQELATAHPLREDLAAALLDALVAAGRPAEALAAYERTRSRLADELGVDPSPELRQRHLEVLRLADRAAAPPTNLRASLTSFVGRDEDLRTVRGRLAGARLVTVVGAGGAGKTRLAGEVAAAVLADGARPAVPDGVWWVELAPVTEASAVDQALLDGLALVDVALPDQRTERGRSTGRTRLLEVLAEARCLLVVDNCEHLVSEVAVVLDEVLRRCPGVRVLATSREPLGIDGEVLHGLGPLPVPPEGAGPAEAAANPAVQLLLDRARAVDPDVVPDEHVVEIVRRLDGIPLAIELAAARLRALSTREVAERLADRFRLLTGGRRTATPRHRTLRAVVEWSWDLLSPAERQVAEHVAVFPAGATEQAVAAVLPGGGDGDGEPLPDVLHALVDKSILVAERAPDGTRYRMLETLREYGTERLAEQGLLPAARGALARWAVDVAAATDPALRGPDQLRALRTFDDERENLLAALRSLGEDGDTAAALQLAVSLGWYWMLRENSEEAGRWLAFATGLPGAADAPTAAVAEAMCAAVDFGPGTATSPERSDRFARLAERLAASTVDHPAVPVLGPLLLLMAERQAEGRAALARALEHPDPWVRAAAHLVGLAYAENAGDVEAVRRGVADGIEQWRAVGDRWGLAAMLTSRGELRTMDGDLAGAAEDLEEAAETVRHLGGTADHVVVLMRLADLRLRAGDPAAARRHLAAMRAQRTLGAGDLLRGVLVAVTAVGIAASEEDHAELQRVYDEVAELLERSGEERAFSAHAGAIGHGAAGAAAVLLGDLDTAAHHLRLAHERAVLARDRPLVAMVGLDVALWLAASGRPEEAARALGAARVLRGTDDPANPLVRRLTARLREMLGGAFDDRYAEGLALDAAAAEALLDPSEPALPGQARRR